MNTELLKARSRRNAPLAALFCTASFATLAAMTQAQAADTQTAAAMPSPAAEEVLVTGSLITGTQAVGVPVTEVGSEDFAATGAITVSEVLKTVPSLYIQPSNSPNVQGGNQTRAASLDIHKMNVAGGLRTLMLIDGMRYSLQREIASAYDPTIIPALATERIDVLADGASATYGSDAVAGVVNVILKKGFDGAVTQLHISTEDGAINHQEAQLFGRTWEGGDITLTFQHYEEGAVKGSAVPYFTQNFLPYGFDDRTTLGTEIPGIVSTGAPLPSGAQGTNCTNCFSVPLGTGTNFVAGATVMPPLTWAQLQANAGVKNEINPYAIAQIVNAQQSNSAVATFDQQITPEIQFFAEGFYTNRRTSIVYPSIISPYNKLTLQTLTVPTGNPYYPTGAPSGLRVSYNFALELPPISSGSEISGRYAGGFNLNLPFDWHGKIFGSVNQENTNFIQTNSLNANNVNAALGNTVAATAASGSTPGIQSFTKPATIPYLNLFCDPTAFQCNSPTTLAYISGYATNPVTYIVHQYGANFDGPLFDLPAGQVKGAIGTSYSTDSYFYETIRTRSPDSPASSIVVTVPDQERREQWAVFSQVNIPIFGDANAIPGFRKLELELSGRYDKYSDFGSTSNPKVALDWVPFDDFTLRGSWGTSFRAPLLMNISGVSGRVINSQNNQPACPVVNGPVPTGTAGAILNPTCTNLNNANNPLGISIQGGSGGLSGITRPSGSSLQPELGNNLNLGFDYAPTSFLKGLDLNLTWYQVNITNVITALTLTGVGNALSNPSFQPAIIALSPTASPAEVTAFQNKVLAILANPQSSVSPTQFTNITYIIDSASRNDGTLYQDGFDFGASYNWDMGRFGAWNVGITGDYTLHQITTVPGGTPVDTYNTNGEPLSFALTYRAHLGVDMGGFSGTIFMDYSSPVSSTNPVPPTFSTAQISALYPGCDQSAANFLVCANKMPDQYLFDVALSYDTRDQPANDYLKNLTLQFVVNNVFGRNPPFAYNTSSSTNGFVGYLPTLYSPFGRTISFTLTKSW